jgi:hypothetical protein
MADSVPVDLRSDAWVIRNNALRLLSACREFLARFASARAANLARRVGARVEHGVSADAVGLTAVDGVGASRARDLAGAGHRRPADLVAAGADELERAGLAPGVAGRVVEAARECPAVRVAWDVPETVARGGNAMGEVHLRNAGGGASFGATLTVEGVEMTATEGYLTDETSLPVGVVGPPDADALGLRLVVAFPEMPLAPVVDERTVRVVD